MMLCGKFIQVIGLLAKSSYHPLFLAEVRQDNPAIQENTSLDDLMVLRRLLDDSTARHLPHFRMQAPVAAMISDAQRICDLDKIHSISFLAVPES